MRSTAQFTKFGATVRPGFSRLHAKRRVIAKLFTGIVQGTANVVELRPRADAITYDVEFPEHATDGIKIGASVALNGTCLTVTNAEKNVLRFDIIPETLSRTNLGQLHLGAAVNFERSVKFGDEVGGHNVSGHVQTTAEIVGLDRNEDHATLTFKVNDAEWMKYILPKGFIAVDGCSLTVGEVGSDWFNVYLIPETMRVTVLGIKQKGDTVNVETDAQTQAIVTAVERTLQQINSAEAVLA